MPALFRTVICLLLLAPLAAAAKPLENLENCTFVPTEWADGDSFLVKLADGTEKTVRLYGADCLESNVNNESDARRLRAQRRYFGITEVAEDARESIEAAKGFGKLAAEETARALSEPFTVHTAFSDARGDARYPRVYGFVTCADGSDLATRLVGNGLARAFGVYRSTPDGGSADEYRASLADVELRAAKLGKGIWEKTDWESLAAQRRDQREDDAMLELAIGKAAPDPDRKIDPNTAARDELLTLPGIGEAMVLRVIEHRPYKKKADLLNVPGIGPTTLRKLMPFIEIEKAGTEKAP